MRFTKTLIAAISLVMVVWLQLWSAARGSTADSRLDSIGLNTGEGPDFSISALPETADICQGDATQYEVGLESSQGFNDPVLLSTSGHPTNTVASFSANPIIPPGSSLLTINNTIDADEGSYNIVIAGMAPTTTHTATVGLDLYALPPEEPELILPADGAIDQSTILTFTWTLIAHSNAYEIQIATDPAFENVVETATISATTYTPSSELTTSTTYFWRVSARNACGSSVFSSIFSFRTVTLPGDCGPGTAPAVQFSEDFEGTIAGWSHGGSGDTWNLSTTRYHSAQQSYHVVNVADISDQWLASPPIALPAEENPVTLRFWNWQEIENSAGGCFDGAILELTNDGSNWIQVPNRELLTDPYDGFVSATFGNPLAGLNAWCGDPQDWLNSVVNLDDYAGQTVRFRFRLGTDSVVSREGWYVDDVVVQSCEVNGPALSLSPSAVASTQPISTTVSRTLTISSTGTADLEWSLATASTADCDSPSQINWLDAEPLNGTASPGTTSTAVLSFDSANLVPTRTYTGTMCLNSNAPATPEVTIPVTLTVEALNHFLPLVPHLVATSRP